MQGLNQARFGSVVGTEPEGSGVGLNGIPDQNSAVGPICASK